MNPLIWWGTVQSSVPRPWLPPLVLSQEKTSTKARRILSNRTPLVTEASPWMVTFPSNFLPISKEESKSEGSSSFHLACFVSGACDWEHKKSHRAFSAAPSGFSFAVPKSLRWETKPGQPIWAVAGGRAKGQDGAVPTTLMLRATQGWGKGNSDAACPLAPRARGHFLPTHTLLLSTAMKCNGKHVACCKEGR